MGGEIQNVFIRVTQVLRSGPGEMECLGWGQVGSGLGDVVIGS